MADEAREYTDEELAELEAEIKRVYRRSYKELTAEWDAYMLRTAEALSVLWFAYQNAPDSEKKAEALKNYQDALKNRTLQNTRYKRMVNDTTKRLAMVNQIAADYVNGKLPDVYRMNYAQIAQEFINSGFDLPSMGTAFDIRSEETIARLIRGEVTVPGLPIPDSLPTRRLNEAKDMLWNSRQINSAVLQGVIKGESVRDISKRLEPIVGNNEKSAIRAARTMITSAENMGRLDSYVEAEREGVVLVKQWISTPDGRVRDWHLSMDGQEVGVNEKFVDGNGDRLSYPGDPSAPGRTVWNCRCTMASRTIGFRRADGSISMVRNRQHDESLHERQIRQERGRRNG